MHVKRVRHRMIRIHLVDQSQLDLVADAEGPVDLRVLGARVAVDELPAHVRRGRHAVHLDHVVFPLDSRSGVVAAVPMTFSVLDRVSVMTVAVVAFVSLAVTVMVLVAAAAGRDDACGQELHAALGTAVRLRARHLRMHRADVRRLFSGLSEQFHAALGTAAGFVAADLRMHRADVDNGHAFRYAHFHLGDERDGFVGRRVEEGLDLRAQIGHVAVATQASELVGE